MDEVFGQQNACAIIPFVTTSSQTSELIPSTFAYLIWFAKDRKSIRFRNLYKQKRVGEEGGTKYRYVELPTGERRPCGGSSEADLSTGSRVYRPSPMVSQSGGERSSFPIEFQGATRHPRAGFWKTNQQGIDRLIKSNRIVVEGRSIAYVRYLDDFPVFPLSGLWDDTWGVQSRSDPKQFVVQTSVQVVQRCLLMTTDPGDLVLDPTCGSGTTALVAENWGRRWITIDTSRVALTLAKHRLMTAKFDYFRLRELTAEDVARNPEGTWIQGLDADGKSAGHRLTFACRKVPHIMLKDIARNTSLDPIFAKYEPILAEGLAALNREVAKVVPELKRKLVQKLITKHRQEGSRAVSDADIRRWLLPNTPTEQISTVSARRPLKGVTAKQVEEYRARVPQIEWREWQVPFDTDPDWPLPLCEALTTYRNAWRRNMDEVNDCISANAEAEELVDCPDVVKDTVRVSGPFTIEGVIGLEEGPDSPIVGGPEEMSTFAAESPGDLAVANAEAHLDKVLRLLKASGIDFPGNKNLKFERLDPTTVAALVHAEGEWLNGTAPAGRVAVSIGPEAGNVTAMQVEEVVRHANRAGYDDVVFAGFGFDAAAQDAIENAAHPKLRLHMALINPDAAMSDLLKAQPGSQVFSVFSAPRVVGPTRLEDGNYVVEVEGMDVYDPVSNTIHPTDKQRIAAWFLDTDYDGRTFCICQAFFPDRGKWTRLARALGDRGLLDEGAFDALSGLRSLPFSRPPGRGPSQLWRIAVKVIDPRGNEGLRVLTDGEGQT